MIVHYLFSVVIYIIILQAKVEKKFNLEKRKILFEIYEDDVVLLFLLLLYKQVMNS